MSWTPPPSPNRILPFRNACGVSSQPNLFDKLVKPQSRPKVAKIATATVGALEGQDAVLNGMTRSLHRRLSALNLPIVDRPIVQRRVA